MKGSTLFLLFFLFIVSFGSCTSTSGPAGKSVIIPLHLGNQWELEMTGRDSNGVISDIDTFSIVVTDTGRYQGELLYVINDIMKAVNRNDGYWSGVNVTDMQLNAKYPAQRGDKFSEFEFVITDEQSPDVIDTLVGHREVLATDSIVTVPAGTFNAYVYRTIYYLKSSGKPFWMDLLYAVPDLGEIKSQDFAFREDGTPWLATESVLIKYILK